MWECCTVDTQEEGIGEEKDQQWPGGKKVAGACRYGGGRRVTTSDRPAARKRANCCISGATETQNWALIIRAPGASITGFHPAYITVLYPPLWGLNRVNPPAHRHTGNNALTEHPPPRQSVSWLPCLCTHADSKCILLSG